MFEKAILGCICILVAWSCNPSSKFEDAPTLEFVNMSKNVMVQGTSTDSIFVWLDFTDGDGDIFIPSSGSNRLNMVVVDMRTGNDYGKFAIPQIPEEGAANGISGTIRLLLFNNCCIYPEDSGLTNCDVSPEFPSTELTLGFLLKDNAGNSSDTTFSTPITLLCQ